MQEVNFLSNKVAHLKLPSSIIDELDQWKLECDKIKNHPLGFLKSHENSGTKGNNFQVSVPSNLIEKSYWLAYTLRSCSQIFKKNHRDLFLRKWDGHFDGYDMWINYSYKGNFNPSHTHAGFISGVIYYSNEGNPTLFDNSKIEFSGVKGDMVLFSSNLEHKVLEQKQNSERVTFAFNIQKTERKL